MDKWPFDIWLKLRCAGFEINPVRVLEPAHM